MQVEATRNVVVIRKNAVQQKNEAVDDLDRKIQHLKSLNQEDSQDQEDVQQMIRDLEEQKYAAAAELKKLDEVLTKY